MADILNRIAEYKRKDVAARKALRGQDRIEADAKAADAPRGFKRALERGFKPGKLALIAEVKKASPSKGLIRADFNPAELARAYQTGGASALSILTDKPSFQGDDAYFVQARAAVTLPAIRKDFVVDPWQIAESRAFGADAILVIMALADDALAAELMAEAARFGMDALVEVHDEQEMDRAGALGAKLVGVNNRDLRSFVTDLKVTARLAPLAPKDALLVTESGIFTPQDVRGLEAAGAHAMLVGESLMRQKDVACATVALLS